ncbi:MAG: F0F1 ATP synthase subunit A [Actinomycetota bacterium]
MISAILAFAAEEEGGSAVPFPPPRNLVEWAPIFGEDTTFEFNKIGLISLIAFAVPVIVFLLAKRSNPDQPSKVRIFAESIVTFVEEQIAKPGIGHGYEPYVPMLTTLFLFISLGNIFEVIPFFNMPSNARMAGPLVLALSVFVMFIAVGVKHHGMSYFKDIVWPGYVPVAYRPLVGFIEFFSVFIARPLSHAVRLFANMLAGHILLVTFGVLTIGTFNKLFDGLTGFIIQPFAWLGSFVGLIAFTGYEVGVSLIQGFVFAILAAVYIGSSLHPAH